MEKKCYKCGSNKIISGARFDDSMAAGGNIQLKINSIPDALIFKGVIKSELRAYLCGDCGYVETYIENPQRVWRHFGNKNIEVSK